MEYENLGNELSLTSVDEEEIQVELSDGSKWNIKTGDISKIVIWYETQRIIVSTNNNEIYPYLLTNLDTAEPDKVEASIA